MASHRALTLVVVASLIVACDPTPRSGPPDAGVEKDTLTIQGRLIDAPASHAEIVATVGAETYRATADAEGRFSLDIVRPRTAPSSHWVILTASGTGAQPMVLKASLGEISQLLAAAGADGVLTRQEHSNAYLTHLTTAQYALLTQAHGGTPPSNLADARAAEKQVDPEQLLQRAAVLKLVTNDPARYPLPAGVASPLSLVQELDAYQHFLTQHSAAVEAAQTSLLADSDTLALFQSAELPSAYDVVDGTRRGFLPGAGARIVLSPAGSGEYLDTAGRHPFTWSVASGALELSFSPPLTEKSYLLSSECPQQVQVELTFTIHQHRYMLLADGAYVEQAHLTRSGEKSYARCGDGSQIPSSPEVRYSTTPLRNVDRLPRLPLTSAQFSEKTWAMDQYFQYGPTELLTDLVTFAANGTGSSLRAGTTFDWQIADGKLVMTYADGSTHHFEWMESLAPVEAFFSQRIDPTGRLSSARYNIALPRRTTAAFTPELLTNASGTYWQTGFPLWRTSSWQGHALEWRGRFGFDLRGDFSAERLNFGPLAG
jgi:hypothetical protein